MKKFRRAIRRLLCLSRASVKQGNMNFNIGGLVFEITENKEDDSEKAPTAWIEVVINQLNMKDLISDEVLQTINEQLSTIKEHTKKQAVVFEMLKKEVQTIDFEELFKDASMLKRIYKIITRTSNGGQGGGPATVEGGITEFEEEKLEEESNIDVENMSDVKSFMNRK